MTIRRLEDVGIVVEDLTAATALRSATCRQGVALTEQVV